MRRIVATFDDGDAAAAARSALRDVGLEPRAPDVENPFFDPVADVPEAGGLLFGGLLGGLLGAGVLFAMTQSVFWVPRLSPIMTAGESELVFLGFGLGAAAGCFLGGVVGTVRELPDSDRERVAVTVPDDRVGDVANLLHANGAREVDGVVTHHEHPLRERAMEED